MRSVSGCCLKEIVTGHRKEYPLGGRVWHETFKVDVCEGCGNEVEEYVLVTECCGTEVCICEANESCGIGEALAAP